jgi:DNA-binding LacI/PurR family transcriptional regulator
MKNVKYSITDVARLSGVSPSTISRVLNNRPGVGMELRKKIENYIQEIDFQPNILARSFNIGSINIIALILGDIRNPFYADLALYMQKFLNEAGFMVMTFNSEYNTEKEVEYIKKCRQCNFAGLVLITAQSSQVFDAIRDVEMPVVLVNRTLENYTGDLVSIDNFQAGYIATKHLIELGHPRVAFISGPMLSSAVKQRYQGYRKVIEVYHIPFVEDYVFYGDLKMDKGREIAKNYVQNIDNLPRAAVVSNDLMALGFIDGLIEEKISVPEMFSIVSFDNIAIGSLHNINLTTVNQHCELISKHAARLILKRVLDKDAVNERIILEPNLIIRGTTAAYNRDVLKEGPIAQDNRHSCSCR